MAGRVDAGQDVAPLARVSVTDLRNNNIDICDAGRNLMSIKPGAGDDVVVLSRGQRLFADDDNPFRVADINNCMYIEREPAFVAGQNQTISVMMVVKLTRDSAKQQMGGVGSSILINLTIVVNAAGQIVQVWASDMDAEIAACNSMRGWYDEANRRCNNSWVSNPNSSAPLAPNIGPNPDETFDNLGENRLQADFIDAENNITTRWKYGS